MALFNFHQLSSMIFPLSFTNGNIYYQATRVICEKLQLNSMAFYTATNSYSNDMLTVKVIGIFGYALAGSFHVYKEVSLYSSTFYKKGHVIRRNLKIPNARVSRFVD